MEGAKKEQLTIKEVFVLPVHLSCFLECTWSSSSIFFEARGDANYEDGLATRQVSGFSETLWSCHTSPEVLASGLFFAYKHNKLLFCLPLLFWGFLSLAAKCNPI